MNEEIVTIRGYECLNTKDAAKFLDMPEGRLIKRGTAVGLTRLRTPLRERETFYARVQLEAMQRGEEIPKIDIP